VALALPGAAEEVPGAGIAGLVDGATVLVGTAEFASGGAALPPWARDVRRRVSLEGATGVYVGVDGELVGALVLDDPIRPETPRVIRSLRRAGVRRMVMVTGDQYGVADMVAAAIGVDAVLAERTPADKVDAVAEERADADGILVMVGDGINDAPALASADVGVAMGARGATASSEAADIVITVDRLDRLPEAIRIAARSRSIALQSVIAGMGMSLVAMLVATTGALPPVVGAMIQEAIDVIVILNALRALTGGMEKTPKVPGWTELSARLRAEHRQLAPDLARIRSLADGLGTMAPVDALAELRRTRTFLLETLLPHEEAEDREVFPFLARSVGNDDATAALHRTHTEIFHLVRFTDRLVAEIPPEGPGPEDLTDLRRVLYGLDAILRLHMAQEEELYLALGDEHPEAAEPLLQGA
jgi:soluble P-type ATPase